VRVPVTVGHTTLTNDKGIEVASVCATCSRCDHETESFGTSDRSVRRCFVLMREECPRGEENFYFDEDDDDDT
jgi:hypothetical protein